MHRQDNDDFVSGSVWRDANKTTFQQDTVAIIEELVCRVVATVDSSQGTQAESLVSSRSRDADAFVSALRRAEPGTPRPGPGPCPSA
jgi:hypothetical protein